MRRPSVTRRPAPRLPTPRLPTPPRSPAPLSGAALRTPTAHVRRLDKAKPSRVHKQNLQSFSDNLSAIGKEKTKDKRRSVVACSDGAVVVIPYRRESKKVTTWSREPKQTQLRSPKATTGRRDLVGRPERGRVQPVQHGVGVLPLPPATESWDAQKHADLGIYVTPMRL